MKQGKPGGEDPRAGATEPRGRPSTSGAYRFWPSRGERLRSREMVAQAIKPGGRHRKNAGTQGKPHRSPEARGGGTALLGGGAFTFPARPGGGRKVRAERAKKTGLGGPK